MILITPVRANELQVTHLLIIHVNTSFSTRLRERERGKSRDWSKHDRSYPVTSIQQHWSAESYKGKNVASSRKPSSPQHLPHLENRPASGESNNYYDSDLKRGMQTVVSPAAICILIAYLSAKKYMVSINIYNITHMYNSGHKCCDFLLKSYFHFGTELERVQLVGYPLSQV